MESIKNIIDQHSTIKCLSHIFLPGLFCRPSVFFIYQDVHNIFYHLFYNLVS